jgi:hypothetical protein
MVTACTCSCPCSLVAALAGWVEVQAQARMKLASEHLYEILLQVASEFGIELFIEELASYNSITLSFESPSRFVW